MDPRAHLPIDSVLGDITAHLKTHNRLVLAAPPGAGKTTRVPLHLLETLRDGGRILLLEPRRIAARGAAARMAASLGEPVGETVGLSTRLERKVSSRTRIEVITDGLFARRILSDLELSGTAIVIFDEIHERSLNIDLGLALARDAQSAIREDLKLIAMSATLDTGKISTRMDCPVIESEGRAWPIETFYSGRPKDRLDTHMARVITGALGRHDGSVLAFLTGASEIRRVGEALKAADLLDTDVFPLFGALPPAEQDAAVKPAAPGRRKIVLSTDIAESAITIEGVNIVVDAGMARVPRYEPGGARTRLVTERAARSSVDQRRGRAGRTGPGVCYRLWDEAETRGLTPEIAPEILRSDLSGLVLTLAEWGESDPANLTWLDPPPPGRVGAARTQLHALGALDDDHKLTPIGREMVKLPISPRLAALITRAKSPGEKALGARIAALLSERGIGGQSIDLATRLSRFETDRGARASALLRQAKRWGGSAEPAGDPARLIASAWPGAIARRREGESAAYLMASGEAVVLPAESPLASYEWLVVADAGGNAKGLRASLAAPISIDDVREISPPEDVESALFDPETQTFRARRIRRIGAIILSEQPLPKPSGEAAREALAGAIAEHGFTAIGAEDVVQTILARIAMARMAGGEDLPDWEIDELAATSRAWLAMGSGRSATLPTKATVGEALLARLDWSARQGLDQLAPTAITLPSGRRAHVDYLDPRGPLVVARVQEWFGPAPHPMIGRGRVALTVSLTSPAKREVAVTQDLPGFWRGGYSDMAKDMRAQYPKHDWPTDPAGAQPHEGRTKARLGKR